MSGRSPRVLIIVQNLPVPLDRRVWMECLALRGAGVGVRVICPKGPDDPWHHTVEGVEIYKYPPPPAASGVAGYAFEFGYCWLVTALLSLVVAVRHGFDAIQACNPPDTYWLLGRLWRLAGKRFVYDQHDLNPEVFLSRFGEPKSAPARVQLAILTWLERQTYRAADHVISTNESYRGVALRRGKLPPERITVVRSGPDTTVMRPVRPKPELRQGRDHLAVYLGIMGPQDGVDQALQAFARLVHDQGRTDCSFALLGFGDCLDELKQLSRELKLTDHVHFTGRVGPSEIADYLSTASVGICPDPKSPLNDVSTMNKTMEYMAYCLPVVSFDLAETRVSAGDAAVYLPSGDLDGFAAAWGELLDNPAERVRRGVLGRQRVVAELDWRPNAEAYLSAWSSLFQLAEPLRLAPPAPAAASDKDYLDLSDPAELNRYVEERT